MANAKANIYPVQLQGAELNLNKYDAEIKQYSGFNKNNAPFVGGCLSNIFTKDETIEGATSKNTYIAPNGDVYRVNTEGLWKNDTKLIDTSEADFFDVVDLGNNAFPENTVYVYDEDIYIYIKNNEFVYHTKDWELSLISSDVIAATFNVNVEYNIIAAVVKRETTPLIKSAYYVWHFNSLGQLYSDGFHKVDENDYITITTEDAYKTPIIKRYDGFRDHGFVILFNNSTVSNTRIGCIYNNNLNNPRWQNIGLSAIVFGENTVNKNIFNFTDNYAYVTGSDEISGSNNGFLPIWNSDGFKYNYSVSISGSDCTITIDYDITDYERLHTKKGRIDLLRNWGIQYGVSVYTTEGTTQNPSQYLNVDDDIGWYASLEDDGLATFKTGGIINDCVLTNNGIATGLSLPGGLVLVTEWNTVDFNYIFFGENNDTWRNNKYIYLWKNISNNHWYKLVKSIPSLRKVNNQIVINANVFFNSYDINLNKLYLFAPAWNNRLIGLRKMYPDFHPETVVTKNASYADVNSSYMIASSINEYELADNSSLILNPVILKGWSGCFTPTVYSVDEKNSLFVNIYHSTSSSNEILYKYSFDLVRQKALVYKKLEGLPFPSNTDGNIQYSPSLFATEKGKYGNLVFISEGGTAYKLMTYNNKAVMSYFLTTAIEGLQDFFTIQGQLYGILDNQIYNFSIVNEIANRGDFIVSVEGLQFVGNTPYEALFFSKTNRCLYSFTGANVLNAKQFVDKISEVRNYKYNPATQSIFLITDIGVIVYSLFGVYQIEFINCQDMYLLNNGVILTDNEGTFKFVKYYKEETTDDYTKENIQLETMFYGMNNQTVTINDCLYFRIFSEEHESGELEVSATTLANRGRTTERTTFKIKASDWDAETHSIYLRYQPKEQRGLGISFKINSPFKIAALSVGSIPDAVLIDRVSKGAINAPNISSNNIDW